MLLMFIIDHANSISKLILLQCLIMYFVWTTNIIHAQSFFFPSNYSFLIKIMISMIMIILKI